MGMYLGFYRIKDTSRDHPKTEYIPEFEDGKFVGDGEFATAAYKGGFDREYIGCQTSYCCAEMYWRPKEFDKERAWLKKTRKVPAGNKPRLLAALNMAERDPELWFDYS